MIFERLGFIGNVTNNRRDRLAHDVRSGFSLRTRVCRLVGAGTGAMVNRRKDEAAGDQ